MAGGSKPSIMSEETFRLTVLLVIQVFSWTLVMTIIG